MQAALRVFLNEIVDYAGLFPPAALALEPATRNFAAYRRGAEAWMLGRFICPAAKLGELSPLVADLFADGEVLRVSALGRGGATAGEMLANLRRDLADMRGFESALPGRAAVEQFEWRVSGDLVREECTGELVQTLEAARREFAAAGFGHVPMACEAPLGGERAKLNDVLSGAAAFFNTRLALEKRGTPADRAIVKIRCGGTDAAAFPSAAELARMISVCLERETPLKFTAGLHHPFPRYDHGVQAMMHGFVNVFAAVVLGHAAALDYHDVLAIVEDTDPAHFEFADDSMSWNDATALLDEIAESRAQRGLAFGSCSFDEPREDLRALAWI
jgi:hypothetical protein